MQSSASNAAAADRSIFSLSVLISIGKFVSSEVAVIAKRNRSIAENVKTKRRKEGRGTGTGKDYKPELTIQDVSSIGLATRVLGWTTGRVHHLMSKLELKVFFAFDWPKTVVDIREQFPLDIEESKANAAELGIPHPRDRKTKELVPMTTDFLITIRKGIHEVVYAYTVKYAKDLSRRRVMEKFEIERVYWSRRNIAWSIITELDIDHALVANVEWLHFYRQLSSLAPLTQGTVRTIEDFLAPKLHLQQTPLRKLTDQSDQEFSLTAGTSLCVVRHLIATRRFEVNMKVLIEPEKVLRLA